VAVQASGVPCRGGWGRPSLYWANPMKRSRRSLSLSAKSGATASLFGLLISLAACGGNPSSPTAPSPQSAPPITVYELGNGVSVPTLVREVKPSYTAQAIAARIQGEVLMSAVVLADGTVGEVTVVRSLDTQYGLDAQAVSAVKQWLFNPGQKDGVVVAVRVTIAISFTLV
jgi:TonB family protein